MSKENFCMIEETLKWLKKYLEACWNPIMQSKIIFNERFRKFWLKTGNFMIFIILFYIYSYFWNSNLKRNLRKKLSFGGKVSNNQNRQPEKQKIIWKWTHFQSSHQNSSFGVNYHIELICSFPTIMDIIDLVDFQMWPIIYLNFENTGVYIDFIFQYIIGYEDQS